MVISAHAGLVHVFPRAVFGEVGSIPVFDIEDNSLVLQEWLVHFDELFAGIVEGAKKLATQLTVGFVIIL